MSIMRGGVTLTRYRAADARVHPDFLDRRIRANLFLPIVEETTDEQSLGWVNIHDFMDTRLAYASYHLEPYVALALRLDRRRVPGAQLKKLHREEVAKALALREGRGLSRADREELKEKVRLELLRRTVPTTHLVSMVWNTSSSEVVIDTASQGLCEIFEDFFRRTFDALPVPFISWFRALDLVGRDQVDALGALKPATLYQEVA